MLSWLGLAKAALSLFARIMEVVKNRQLMDAGERRQIARSLARIQTDMGIEKDVAEQVAVLSDAQVDDALDRGGDFR